MQQMLFRGAIAATVALTMMACADAPTAPAPVAGPALAAGTGTIAWTDNDIKREVHRGGVQIPCGRMGLELLAISGYEHVLAHQSFSPNGDVKVKMQTNAQEMTALGMVSGDTYRLGGMTAEEFSYNVYQLPYSYEYTNNFVVTSPGATGNIVAHEVLHVNILADGTWDVQTVRFSAECK